MWASLLVNQIIMPEKIKEALKIHLHKPTLNKDQGLEIAPVMLQLMTSSRGPLTPWAGGVLLARLDVVLTAFNALCCHHVTSSRSWRHVTSRDFHLSRDETGFKFQSTTSDDGIKSMMSKLTMNNSIILLSSKSKAILTLARFCGRHCHELCRDMSCDFGTRTGRLRA